MFPTQISKNKSELKPLSFYVTIWLNYPKNYNFGLAKYNFWINWLYVCVLYQIEISNMWNIQQINTIFKAYFIDLFEKKCLPKQ